MIRSILFRKFRRKFRKAMIFAKGVNRNSQCHRLEMPTDGFPLITICLFWNAAEYPAEKSTPDT
jgi:hypothetical protein